MGIKILSEVIGREKMPFKAILRVKGTELIFANNVYKTVSDFTNCRDMEPMKIGKRWEGKHG